MTPGTSREETIEISEEGFRTLFNNLPIACFGYDREGHVQIWNRAYEDLYGLKAREIVNFSILGNVTRFEDRQVRKKIIRKVFAGKSLYDLEWEERRTDGSTRIVHVDTFPLRNTVGNVIMGICACIDITEQKRSEEILMRAAREWRETFDTMADSVSIIDGECRIQRTNEATAEMFDLNFQDLLGRSCYELFHSTKSPVVDCPFQRMLKSRKSESGEFYLDNLKQWVSVTVNPLLDSEREIIGGVHVAHDITHRKRGEKALREERDKAQKYLDIAEVMLVVLNQTGRIGLINRKGCRILGYAEEELLGKNWFDTCLPAHIRETVRSAFQRLISGEDGSERSLEYGENPVLTQSGEERKIAWRNTVLTDETGAIIGTLSSGEDITEHEQLRNQLLQAEKMSALGQLISGVAHELNNPMTGILGFSQLLLTSPNIPEKEKKHLEKINREAERTRGILQNLLTFARQRKPEKRRVWMNDIVNRTLDLRAYELNVTNIEVIRKIDQDVPSLLADEHQLQQVFLNIIINAEQAMLHAHGKGTLTVATQCDAKNNEIHISFQDDGPGISEEHLPKIFDPFFTTKPDEKGTGLGLSISHSIIQEHGGHITVMSEKDRGTTFTVILPVVTLQDLDSDETASKVELLAGTGSKKVLVVDDEPCVTDLVREILEKTGHTVKTANNGKTAIRTIDEEHFDVVVSDMKMPVKDGSDIYLHCKEKKPDLAARFLFLTGDIITTDSLHFMEEHRVSYLSKPFNIEDLVSSVNLLFQSK